ncbi:VWA domain-containing protein [Clostridium botulinum]|nr:VWA domain-containing protein [Clostridium botulinum]
MRKHIFKGNMKVKISSKKNKRIFIRSMITLLVMSILSIQLIIVNAADTNISDKPSFEVQINEAEPNPALVGEDITIKGKIIPKPFEMDIEKQQKEIVLVLDTSGSMDEKTGEVCTNNREWYCTTHNSSDPYHSENFFYPHNWINDYCKEHRKAGEHYGSYYENTKMEELKKAANNFIDKMKDIPDLKIGIVSYSTNGIIQGQGFSNNTSDLKRIVESLNAKGGTNTGEGLRKAQYMLQQGDKDAKKTIVFMSDGLPTYYSIEKRKSFDYDTANSQYIGKYYDDNNRICYRYYDNDKNIYYDQYYNRLNHPEYRMYYDHYIKIDKNSPSVIGYGSEYDFNAQTYAEEIGEIIKNNKSNAFSIGYGLGNKNSDANKIMKKIHDSMGGDEESFFATDVEAIDKIFSQIADKIIESYTIDNLEMNMNFKSEDGFSLKIGGNTVKLNNVVYKKVSEKYGKILYQADEVPFKFIIKGIKVGEYENIFKYSSSKFLWKDTEIPIPITIDNSLIIKIKNNELPNIQTKLTSDILGLFDPLDEIEVKYAINTEPFKYNVENDLVISDAQLNLDLGDNFELVEAGILEKIDNEKNKYKVKLPEIKYELQNEGENNGKWIQKNTIEVKFKIKKSINSGYRDLGFGAKDNNNISYSSFSKKNIFNNIPTPIINYKGSDVRHGIYYGIVTDGKPNINVSTVKSYPKGARINFGGDFKYNGQKNIQLNIDNHENIEVDGAIKIYKIENNGLSLLKSINETGNQKKYNIDLTNLALNNEDKILILYNEFVLNISGTFTNAIKIDDSSVERATIKVEEKDIPELF